MTIHRRTLFATLPTALLVAACQSGEPVSPPDELVVLTRNAPTTYYVNRHGETEGPEYEMALAFAESIDRDVRFEIRDSVGDIFGGLENGEGHIAAAGLTLTESRAGRFLPGPAYMNITEEVVCRPNLVVREPADLPGLEIAVIDDSSYSDTLGELQAALPELSWQTVGNQATEQLLYETAESTIDCTLVDSNILSVHQRYMPRLEANLTVGSDKSLVWYVDPEHEALAGLIEEWFDTYRSGGLAEVTNHYYGHLDQFDAYDVEVFRDRIETVLPIYRPLFEEAAVETGFDWTFLAAMSYQESRWDPLATSPTGVRGMMMLTGVTAEAMDVADRLDPEESILGGARYLRERLEGIPPYIDGSERLWMALAGYNIGQSHLRDARMLAVRVGENPNTWIGVKATLPLLTERRYYQDLLAGYARGHEPVVYVGRIRNYHEILLAALSGAI